MRRACKISLKFATASKRRRLDALLAAYRAAVNFYIKSLWATRGRLDKETLARLPDSQTRLSARYKSQALKQALETVVATRLAVKQCGRPCRCPVFNGAATLDAKFIKVKVEDKNHGDFDVFVTISSLQRGKRITLPSRATVPLRKWLAKPGAKLIQGASLSDNSITLWVECAAPVKPTGSKLGIDIGVNKLISLSTGVHLGREFKQMRDKIVRKKPGSRSKRRALIQRDQFIRQQVNRLPWDQINLIAVEDLNNLKKGKKRARGKNFRKAMAPWSYRQVIEAIRQKAEENGVYLQLVPPAYTSRTCPQCGTESIENRKGETFHCVSCAYTADADTVGAVNVLNKALLSAGSLESPVLIAC